MSVHVIARVTRLDWGWSSDDIRNEEVKRRRRGGGEGARKRRRRKKKTKKRSKMEKTVEEEEEEEEKEGRKWREKKQLGGGGGGEVHNSSTLEWGSLVRDDTTGILKSGLLIVGYFAYSSLIASREVELPGIADRLTLYRRHLSTVHPLVDRSSIFPRWFATRFRERREPVAGTGSRIKSVELIFDARVVALFFLPLLFLHGSRKSWRLGFVSDHFPISPFPLPLSLSFFLFSY